VPLCPPQIPHGMTRAWTRASVVRGRQLSAWTMARPNHEWLTVESVGEVQSQFRVALKRLPGNHFPWLLAVPWLRRLVASPSPRRPGQSMWDMWWAKWHWDRFYPVSTIPSWLSILMTWGWTVGPLVAVVQRHSLTASMWTTTNVEWLVFSVLGLILTSLNMLSMSFLRFVDDCRLWTNQ
jgi:hypothetical protein